MFKITMCTCVYIYIHTQTYLMIYKCRCTYKFQHNNNNQTYQIGVVPFIILNIRIMDQHTNTHRETHIMDGMHAHSRHTAFSVLLTHPVLMHTALNTHAHMLKHTSQQMH